jgi:S1-C subfamily serine protease
MKNLKILLSATAILLFAGQTLAQSQDEEERRAMEASKAEYSERLRGAEDRMEQAARQIAEITRERLPQMQMFARRVEMPNRPRIGITIDGNDEGEPVEGVAVQGVTPGSPADDAGLRAKDVITSVNGESLTADSSMAANKILLEFMAGVEEGDALELEYLRNGNVGSVELLTKIVDTHAFWAPGDGDMHIESIPGLSNIVREFKFEGGFPWVSSGWGSMELVALNAGLGKYFGTDSGLLVVSAPKSEEFELQDGDVIQTIDGREPSDVRHAMRILSSYQSGEKLELGIMRDQKKRTLDIEVPADHRGSLHAPPAARPAKAPVAPRPVPASVST